MKKLLLFILAISPIIIKAQEEMIVKCPSDRVASSKIRVESDFDQERGLLKVRLSGEGSEDVNAMWLMKDTVTFKKLRRSFAKNGGRLKKTSFSKHQIGFMNLKKKNAYPIISVTGAQVLDCYVQTNSGIRKRIHKQMLPLDNLSAVVLKLQVPEDVETVVLELKNPVMTRNKRNGRRYKLAYIGDDVKTEIDVKRDYCTPNTCLLAHLKECDSIFSKSEEELIAMKEDGNTSIGKVKDLSVKQLAEIDMMRFENTKCQDIEDAFAHFKALKQRIENFDIKQQHAAAAVGGGGSGTTGNTPSIDDCNYRKVNDDLNVAIVKMNTFANEWMTATDPAVKKAKKLAFDSLVKTIDAKINSLSPSCKKKISQILLKNYQAAKKLITN